MSDINKCTFSGNLVDDPVLLVSKSGTTYTRFTLASAQRTFDKSEGAYVDRTSFIKMIAYSDIARQVVEKLHKGAKAHIECVYEQSMYKDSRGQTKKDHIFRIIAFDLVKPKNKKWSSSNWI